MAVIDNTQTVRITLNDVPQGFATLNTNNICIFSNETAGFADEYKVYGSSPVEVEADFGTDSVTAKMARAILAQTPNLRSGSGSLIVVPYVATNGTSGSLETGDLSLNVENFKSITNGEMTITVDKKPIKLINLNFASVENLDDIAKIITSRNPDVFITVEENKIKFTSKTVGTNSTVTIETLSGSGTDITTSEYLNVSAAKKVTGANAIDVEPLPVAVQRASSKIFFGVVVDTCLRDNASVVQNATKIEALPKKIYVEVTGSLLNIDVLGKEIKQGGFKQTKLLAYSKDSLVDAKRMLGAYVSRACATNYRGSNTTLTMNLKELATIQPDDNCNDTVYTQAKINGVDIYGLTSGLGCTYSFRNAGGYMDDMTGTLSIVSDLEIAGLNVLKQTGTKIPQTEAGMTTIKNAFAQICERYVNNGFLGLGLKWNSPDKFGDPEDFDRNITELGYYIYSLPVAEQTQAEREERIAPLIQIALKSAGAVHIIEVYGQKEA